MWAKETFDKKYPLLVDIFTDDAVRSNLMSNADFARKYTANNSMIKIFIYELNKRFSMDIIRNIIMETVWKLPDNLLVSFITSYLNSDEATKANLDVVSQYNKTSNLGLGVMYYMEENGIVSNKKYKELPYLLIDDRYRRLRKEEYGYNEDDKFVPLDDVYEELTYPEREVIVEILENGDFNTISEIFEPFSYSLKTIISILYTKGLDSRLLNKEVVNQLTPYYIMIIICVLLEHKKSDIILVNIYKIISSGRINLLNEIIASNLIDKVAELSWSDIESLSDDDILKKLTAMQVTLAKKDE